jgi:hypothetical protein
MEATEMTDPTETLAALLRRYCDDHDEPRDVPRTSLAEAVRRGTIRCTSQTDPSTPPVVHCRRTPVESMRDTFRKGRSGQRDIQVRFPWACCPSHGGRLARHESSPVQKSAFGPALGVIPGLGRGSGATSTKPEPQRQFLGHEHERPAACIQAGIDQPTDRVQLSAEIANGWSLMVFSTPW